MVDPRSAPQVWACVTSPPVGEFDAPAPIDGRARCLEVASRLSARSSGGSWPRGLARVCRCVHSSNGGRTASRRAKAEQPSWRPGPSQVEPPIWSASSRRSTHLAFRDTGPRASPALRRPCSLCNHLTNSRRAYRQFRSGAAPTAAAASHPGSPGSTKAIPAVNLAASLRSKGTESKIGRQQTLLGRANLLSAFVFIGRGRRPSTLRS